jgi:hypothetical protein
VSASGPRRPSTPFHREMTVAQIRKGTGQADTAVAFLESARFYTLRRDHPRYGRLVARLKDAMTRRRVVTVRLASVDGDVIEDVELR